MSGFMGSRAISPNADPRTTMRYDGGRGPLDRHAIYIVATFLAGPLADNTPRANRALPSVGNARAHQLPSEVARLQMDPAH